MRAESKTELEDTLRMADSGQRVLEEDRIMWPESQVVR